MNAIAGRMHTYLRLGRVSNLPTVWSNVAAGALLAGGAAGPHVLLPPIVALSLFYVAGMFLNDAFDRHFDARARPDRPIPAGQIAASEVFASGFGMMAAALAILAVQAAVPGGNGSLAAVVSGAALAGAILVYDRWHKGNPAGPVVMGLCRVLVYTTAALSAVGRITPAVVAGCGALLSYVAGLTYAAKQEDIGKVSNMWPLLLMAVPFVYAAPVLLSGLLGAVLYVLFWGWIVYGISLLRRGGPSIGKAVACFIAGISLLDAMLIALSGNEGAALVASLGMPLTLLFQRYVRGT
jgi:4-hydroxybenzoate polyprenyltransferase